jgi:putative hydrolase of the HAD superfamily
MTATRHGLNRYEVIVFDAGGTLISADWDEVTRDLAAAAAVEGLAIKPETARDAIRLAWREVVEGHISDQADSPGAVQRFWHQILGTTLSRAAGLPVSPAADNLDPRVRRVVSTFYATFEKGYYHRLIEGSCEALAALSVAGYRLGMLSNWSPALPDILERLRIRHYFEFVIVSSLVGHAKPDRAIFDLAVEAAGCQPGRMLYVGDSPGADVRASRAAGWDAILITHRHHGRYSSVDVPIQVTSLDELVRWLGADL